MCKCAELGIKRASIYFYSKKVHAKGVDGGTVVLICLGKACSYLVVAWRGLHD